MRMAMEQPPDFVERNVLTEEKFFFFLQKPNRKKDGMQSDEHLHAFCETRNKNEAKVTIFITLLSGMTPIFHAVLDNDGYFFLLI